MYYATNYQVSILEFLAFEMFIVLYFSSSEIARDYVLRVLVPNWLKYFNYNYYEFLECIHVEKIPDTGIKVLKAIFE